MVYHEDGVSSSGSSVESSASASTRHDKSLDLPVVIVLVLICLGALPILFAWIGTPPFSSYGFNMAWFTAFEAQLAQGVLYPRDLPDLWYGLGGLDFFFYAPLPFYVAAGPARWMCESCTVQTVFALQGGLMWGASILAFYPLARRFVGPIPAAVAALTYGVLPYHLNADWFARQAVGEFAAFVFVPIVALGVHSALRDHRLNLVLPLTLATLILSHLPTTLLAVHVFGAIYVAHAVLTPRRARAAFLPLVTMGIIGVMLAAPYWLPALALLGDVSPEALYDIEIMKPIPHLLFHSDALPFRKWDWLNFYTLAAGLAAAGLLVYRAREIRAEVLIWALVPLAMTAFLNTALSAPIWKHWIIDMVQFPYRLMLFSDLAIALTVGWLISSLTGIRRVRSGLAPAAAVLLIGLAVVAQGPLLHYGILKAQQIKGAPVDMQGALEYMPPQFYRSASALVEERGWVYWRTREVVKDWVDDIEAGTLPALLPISSDSRRRVFETPPEGGPTLLAIPYWHHLVAKTSDGVPVPLCVEEQHGLTMADVPEAAARVIVTLPQHWSETLGFGLATAALLVIGLLAFGSGRRSGAKAVIGNKVSA